MRIKTIILASTLTIIIFSATSFIPTPSANRADTPHNHLFTVGVGAGLIGGLYDGSYPYGMLKKHGNFGLGAPDKLDGELVIFQGKIYQTQHTGKTFLVDDRHLTLFAIVHFFQPDKKITPGRTMDKKSLFDYLD